jgi:hypothetical protein
MTRLSRNSYAAGHFELRIDGHEPTAFVKSVEGGWSFANFAEQSAGASPQRVKQISRIDIDPITVEFGLAGAKDMLRWIQKSWSRKEDNRRNGQITHADFNMRSMFEHEFYQALLTSTTFPALDGSSKDGGYVTCTLQPERVTTKALGSPGPQISGTVSEKQKMWTPSAFRLSIDGIDGLDHVNKIESFTVTQDTRKSYAGGARFPEVVPTNLKFPNIKGTISLKYADGLLGWHDDYIRSQEGAGTNDSVAQKSGAIELLSTDRTQTLLRINLSEVGLVRVDVEKSEANGEKIKRLKFELFVHGMAIEGSSALGFV